MQLRGHIVSQRGGSVGEHSSGKQFWGQYDTGGGEATMGGTL